MLITDLIPKQGELPLFTDYDSISREVERVINTMNIEGPVNNADLELLAYIKEFHSDVFRGYESRLMFSLGLFYKTSEPKTLWDIAFNTFARAIEIELNGIYTPVQASAYKQIGQNKYFSFSAPTSAGKSHLFRKLIQDEKGDILIVLPSRALIAEYLILVREALAQVKDVLVLQFIENINQAKTTRRVYIVTPERCKDLFRELNKPNNTINVSLVLFDEAQISEESVRGIRFDSLVRRINKAIPNVKIVFTHPFIENPGAQLNKHTKDFQGSLNAISYKQNVVGKIFLFRDNDQLFHFSPYNDKKDYRQTDSNFITNRLKSGKTLLIYVSKKSIYDRTFEEKFKPYIKCCPQITNPNALAIIDELKDYLGVTAESGEKYSLLIDLMGRGVVIHHGSIPLRARLLIEKFIKEEHARICFCTSTLQQGVNMPFDIVWIDNFRFDGNGRKDKEVDEDVKALELKNLIGRAGRSSNQEKDHFDYGYVIVEKKNLKLFNRRLNITPKISSESMLDSDLLNVDEDVRDIVEAIKNNTFDDESNLTQSQLDRMIANPETINNVEFILETLFDNDEIISGDDYYALSDYKKKKIRAAFKDIYTTHLRRQELNTAEKSVLSASIPILLWQIRGKSFKEIISLRYSFLAQKKEIRDIRKREKLKEISSVQAEMLINELKVRYTQVAAPIPNSKLRRSILFENKGINEIDYDRLVCDTYDYIDKVISLSVSDPICAACMLYKTQKNDERADTLINYLRYGTNDPQDIWLIKYGFTFEDIEWLNDCIVSVDEQSITFSDNIKDLSPAQRELISRYE